MEQTPPTVREVLASAEVQRGHPVVCAGRGSLDREVTWVHVLELSSVTGLLRGGELVLLTGVALPDSNDASWPRCGPTWPRAATSRRPRTRSG